MIELDEDAYQAQDWLIEVSRAATTTVREVVHCSNVHLESLVRHSGEAMSRIGRPVR